MNILYAVTAAAAVDTDGFISPLPFVSGVRFVDARSASRMSFDVNIVGRVLTWWLAGKCFV
jgi:hypothetical protein